jgi:3-phenylpropionate/trans-cinnamate dioxygenase ferredoxin component
MGWEKVATLDEVPESGTHRTELGGEPICVVRLGGEVVRAVHDTCSHQEYSLAEGYAEEKPGGGGLIECALHGSMFDLDTGDPDSLPATRPIPVYACKVEDGAVWVDPDQQLNDAPVPRHD